MEIFLLVVVLVFVLVIFKQQQNNLIKFQIEIRNLAFKLDDLKKQIDQKLKASKEIDDSSIPVNKTVVNSKDDLNQSVQILNKDVDAAQVLKPEGKTASIFSEKTNSDNEKNTIQTNEISIQKEIELTKQIANPKVVEVPKPYVVQKSWLANFKERNPDIEKFIGENLISKLGILILVLGISFFVKYAIDKDWINEPARVGIGILAGGIIMAVAHRLRRSFPAFSSVFVAGSVSVFYFTIGIAFHDYALFNQTVAFLIMVVITVFSAFVSISYNRKELAILTLIGGFAVPFMVSTGSGNYNVLFTYIAILNVGMLGIAYFKKWTIITLLAFVFSSFIFVIWFVFEFVNKSVPYFGAIGYASLMFIIFSIAAVINNIRNKGAFSKIEYFILLANTAVYFGIGATIFQNWNSNFKGAFTLILALYNLLFAIVLYRKFGIKKNAIYFLLGLALTFVTITIPFQFNGNFITLFWAAEAVLLLWLSQKSKITTFRVAAIVVQFLMIISLVIDWGQNYFVFSEFVLTPFLNKMFITGCFAVASFVFSYFILSKENENVNFYCLTLDTKIYKNITLIIAVVLGYFVGIIEIDYQVENRFLNQGSILAYVTTFHYVYTTLVVYFLFKQNYKATNVVGLVVVAINILWFLIVSHRLMSKEIFENLIFNYNSNSAYILHYVIFICFGSCLFLIIKNRQKKAISKVLNTNFAMWIYAFCIVFALSNEIMLHSLFASAQSIKDSFIGMQNSSQFVSDYAQEVFYKTELSLVKKRVIKIGFPILWGLLSFVFLIFGIKKQIKQLRIIALALLGLTVVKLFIFDINVSGPGRIVAFILLGILILIISFAYQKLNRKNLDQPKNNQDEKNN